MTEMSEPKDLIVLVADLDMEETVKGILNRHQALNIRKISFEIKRHQDRDAGCRAQGVEFLGNFKALYSHAILMFDHEGSGREAKPSEEIERQIDQKLAANGWDQRAATIVLDPELEIWIWSDSTEVDQICGWGNRIPSLRDWLIDESFLTQKEAKPARPKEAFRHALKHVKKPLSASLFRKLAETVGLQRCTDRTFLRLKNCLQQWFPLSTN
ncbi:MAG: hypothetical protein WEB58_11580 [Planctomycetaceae bacterium]